MATRVLTAAVLLAAFSIVGASLPWQSMTFGVAAAQRPPLAQPTMTLLDETAEVALLLPDQPRVRKRTGRLTTGLRESLTGIGRPIASTLALNLFSNVVLTAVFERSEQTDTARTWIGRLEGQPLSLVALTVVDGALAGTVSYPGGLYEISSDPDGTTIISEVDSTLLPPEAEPLRVPGSSTVYVPEAEAQAVEPAQPATALTQIDVAVFYTAKARSEAGGTSKMQALVANRIATANTVYKNSGINQKLRLVHSAAIAYKEVNAETDLFRLRVQGDGYMTSAHTIRNTKKADLVALIVGGDANAWGACGIGYIFTPPVIAANMAPYGFSSQVLQCLSGFTFEHELGHNMGAHHDSYVTEGKHGAYTYSHGYVDLAGRFRTIMAYLNRCTDSGVYCNRIGFFSNPAKRNEGRVIGRTNANNTRTLNNTAKAVAAFR